MARRVLLSGLVVVVVVAVAVGLSMITALRRPPAQSVELVRSTSLTCVPAGQALVFGEGPISLTPLGEPPVTGQAGPLNVEIAGPASLTSNHVMVAGVLTAEPVRGYAACAAPLSSGILQVLDPASTELLLVNTDANEAVVDLTLLGPNGEVPSVGSRGIAISPGASRTIALSVLAPGGPVGVRYDTTEGRVSALAMPIKGRTVPMVSAGATVESQVIGGIPALAQNVRLVVSNPSENRVAVDVAALGATSSYQPAPTADLVVEPLTTVVVDLGSSLGGEASALSITADEPVGASVLLGGAGAETALRAAAPGRRAAVQTADTGSVLLTNPGVEPVHAEVSTVGSRESVQVQPGTTAVVAVTSAEVGAVEVEADGPVIAVAWSVDALLAYPLVPTETDAATAGVVRFDPSLR